MNINTDSSNTDNQEDEDMAKFGEMDSTLLLKLAREARAAKKEWGEANLKLDWQDLPHWKTLAHDAGVKLPIYYTPSTDTRHIKRLFKKKEIDIHAYLVSCGVLSLKDLNALNPNMPAFASIGFALEYIDEQSPCPTELLAVH